jgi:hypothetical protein
MKPGTGEMNQKVTFNTYTLTSDSGGNPRTLNMTFSDWVQIEQVNGSRRLEQAAISFTKAYKITKRRHVSQPLDPALTEIIYGGLVLSIEDIKPLSEGRQFYDEILCYTNAL